MEIAKIEVSRADARKIYCGTLTTGMVGVKATFAFDAAWDGLQRVAVFKAGSICRDVILAEDAAEIPWEVLAKPYSRVSVGVYGINVDGTLVIPTVWVELGGVAAAADPSGDPSTAHTPEVWAQILGLIGDLNQLSTEAKDTLVAAINEAASKGGGIVDMEKLKQIVEDYLDENMPDGDAYELPAATADSLGGIKAEPAGEGDTQPVRIGEDGKLYTAPGGAGYTPVKGVDYYTEADKAELVAAVLAGIPAAEGVAF